MAFEVVMPQMGAEMKEGTILRWLKKEGDPVERGEIIAEIETDKANVEIEAFESGVFRKALASEGDTVPVGTVIAIIGAPDEDISAYTGAVPQARAARAPAAPPAEAERPAAVTAEAPAKAPVAPTAPPPQRDGRVRASPLARRLAQELGIDLSQVRGTGPDGRIVRRDVEAFAARRAEAPAPEAAPAAAPPPPPAGVEVVPMSRIRQAIARNMAASKREAPHYYLTLDVDMTEAQRIRSDINAFVDEAGRVTVNDLIVKAVARALEAHPIFNSWFVDGEIRHHDAVNVCIAIALDDGLIAPALLDVTRKSLSQIARESRSLAERARQGTLRSEELTAGTFTITNLGAYGIETLIAIIQPPQTAILGVGTILPKPVVRDGQVVVREMMKLALSADHRVTDGAQGARFLTDIARFLEHPLSLVA
jgi:pyruvate dehydrogenase E2 component (dihydrolipoamide acetyltransferase)